MMKIDQALEVEVVRREFFRGARGTLAYVESAPPAPKHEHQQCNCTKEVMSRPLEKPFQTKLAVMMKQAGPDRDFSVTLGSSPWYTFRWGKSHAYFIGGKNTLNAEISVKGQGLVDCLFGKLYFGRDVDISRMVNGHSPSRLVDLERISPDDVWVHECTWGAEAMAFLTDPAEKQKWQEIRKKVDRVEQFSLPYEGSKESVDQIREVILKDRMLMGLVVDTKGWFEHILDHLKETDFYKMADQVEKETHKESRKR